MIGNDEIFGISSKQKYATNPQTAGIAIRLNTAEPTIVPIPISEPAKTPITEVNNSGADVPIAKNVAPAMSLGNFSASIHHIHQYHINHNT